MSESRHIHEWPISPQIKTTADRNCANSCDISSFMNMTWLTYRCDMTHPMCNVTRTKKDKKKLLMQIVQISVARRIQYVKWLVSRRDMMHSVCSVMHTQNIYSWNRANFCSTTHSMCDVPRLRVWHDSCNECGDAHSKWLLLEIALISVTWLIQRVTWLIYTHSMCNVMHTPNDYS